MNEQPCKHRWEPSRFGRRYWGPGANQYECQRCGEMRHIEMEERDAEAVGERVERSGDDATA